jgi:hypothetical protein
MENVELNYLTTIHQVVQQARFDLDDIATKERDDLDSLPLFTRSCSREPKNRLNAIDEAVRRLMQAEEMIELALSYRHSCQDARIQTELEEKSRQESTCAYRSLSGLLDDILSSSFPFNQLP